MKVFASGSCRLLTVINDGRGKIEPIHSMFKNFVGINFLGKLHNSKQHIQFIRWINDEIEIPQNILSSFLTSYGLYNDSRSGMEPLELNPIKKQKIKHLFHDCDYYIFEICSLKLYEKNGYQVQFELTKDYSYVLQSETDLYNDLEILQGIIPKGKKIIFQTQLRPNIIYNDDSKIINKREIIYNVVNKFCNTHENAYLYDPSVLLNTDKSLYDGDTHLNDNGNAKSFNYIYDNFIQKFMVKSALLLTGNLRTFEQCIGSFERLCEKIEPDVFLCISNKEYDLHPFQRDASEFDNDTTLTKELITLKLKTSPLLFSKIKQVLIMDKDEEDTIVYNQFIHLFDPNKSWTGLDIFKQYYKMKRGIELIELYEKENKITYDLIIKTRFDLTIDISSLPALPIRNDELFIPYSDINAPSDHIFICNNLGLLKSIQQGLHNLFLNNIDKEISKSVHTILGHIFKTYSMQVNPTIDCQLNRDYKKGFDTKISIVTAFYDIGRNKWDCSERSNDLYFKNCEKVLKQRYPIYIFTTENFRTKILDIRKKTDPTLFFTNLIVMPLEELNYYDRLNRIDEIQRNNKVAGARTEPEYTKPEYVFLIYNKVNFLCKASKENNYSSQYFQWIDFGIHDNIIFQTDNDTILNTIMYKPGKIRLAGFSDPIQSIERNTHYTTHKLTVAAGLFGGDATSIQRLNTLFEAEVQSILTEGYANQEQYVLYWILSKKPDLFDYYIIGCPSYDPLRELYFFTNTHMNIALCFSGHMRSYNDCKKNINDKIIKPLKDTRANIHLFLSSWNDSTLYDTTEFTDVEIEEPKEDFFQNNFTKDTWNAQFSGPTTCPNAVSMHYKMSRVYAMAKRYSKQNKFEYDVIIRIRPDVIYDNKLPIHLIKESISNANTLFMPNHHGRYEIVTKCISDQFFFGHNESMSKAMTCYESMDRLLKEEIPYTGEGFLWKQIQLEKLVNKRFMYAYGIVRQNNRFERIV